MSKYRVQPRELSDWVKQIYMLNTLEDKKAIALDMIYNLAFATKKISFRAKLEKCKTPIAIDKLMTNILLSGERLSSF